MLVYSCDNLSHIKLDIFVINYIFLSYSHEEKALLTIPGKCEGHLAECSTLNCQRQSVLSIVLLLSFSQVCPQWEGVLRGRSVPHGYLLAVSVSWRNLFLLQGRVRWAGLWKLLRSWRRVLSCLLRYTHLPFHTVKIGRFWFTVVLKPL